MIAKQPATTSNLGMEKQKRHSVKICSEFPKTGLVRLWQIIGDEKRGIPPYLPVGRTTFLGGVKSHKYPIRPIRLGVRTVAYRAEEVTALLNLLSAA